MPKGTDGAAGRHAPPAHDDDGSDEGATSATSAVAHGLVVQDIAQERMQGHGTRRHLYGRIEEHLRRPLVSFVTSFQYPVMLENEDADMLEGVLQKADLSAGLALLISSPGGDGLAAERIINICRSYSGTGEYVAVVPGKAKSAATMICLGGSKVLMSSTSELGAIDPQIVYPEQRKRFSVYNIIESYERLFKAAVDTDGHLEPFLQQLANYDYREIEEFRAAMALSDDIAVKALKAGMLRDGTEDEIRERIRRFLSPKEVKAHARPIYASEARESGLVVELAELKSDLWSLVRELHVRLDRYVSQGNVAKCIESSSYSFIARAGSATQGEDDE